MLAPRNPTLYGACQSVNESMKQSSQVGKCVCVCVYVQVCVWQDDKIANPRGTLNFTSGSVFVLLNWQFLIDLIIMLHLRYCYCYYCCS